MATILDAFIHSLIGSTAWGVRQGYGSFLYFNFGEPKLIIRARKARKSGKPERDAYVQGASRIWINCCHWRILDVGKQLAHSEDDRETIDRAMLFLNGQNLIAIEADDGRSVFRFDLGGLLETTPYKKADGREQWIIFREAHCFAYRGDGFFHQGPANMPPDDVEWLYLS